MNPRKTLVSLMPEVLATLRAEGMSVSLVNDLEAALAAPAAVGQGVRPTGLIHLAVSDEHGLRWMSGRRHPQGVDSVELYAAEGHYGRLPSPVYLIPPSEDGQDPVGHVSKDAAVAHMRVNLPEGTAVYANPTPQAAQGDTFNAEKCSDEVFKHGTSIGLFDIPKETANTICAGISAATRASVDWHYIGGRVHIKALPAPMAAKEAG